MSAKNNTLSLDTIKKGDCVELLKTLPENSIDCCITDPPYNYEFIGQKWDNEEIKRRVERVQQSKTLVKNIPYGSGLSGGVRDKKWYERNRKNTLEYMQWIETWGKELLRVLKPGGYVYTFNSSRSIANVQVALENIGFYARDILVWRRNSGIPKGLNVSKKLEKMGEPDFMKWDGWHSCFRNEWEAISLVQKPLEKNYINTLSLYGVGLLHVKDSTGFCSNILENIVRDKIQDYNEHVTVKPLELIKRLIKYTIPLNSEYIVLDPFIGSGTTALAAKELGVHYIGFEKSAEYIEIAKKRLQTP
jgi:site-specific DNA-methyltransferase (adenine-specific)